MFSKLLTDRRGPIGYLVLNAPERRNAISLDMWQSLPGEVATLGNDPQIRCIVVAGAGGEAFSAGADISEFETNRAGEQAARIYEAATHAATEALMQVPKPVVAAIRGICFGGGFAVAMACDLRFAAADARFCIPAARLGLAYGIGGTAHLVERIGASLTAEMLMTGRVYTAHEGLMRGLVHQVVPVADFDDALAGYTATLASNAPLSICAAKRAIRHVATRREDLREAAEQAAEACTHSRDYAEGRNAFAGKRKPHFTGH